VSTFSDKFSKSMFELGKSLMVAQARYNGQFMASIEGAVDRAMANAKEERCEVMRVPDGCLDDTRAVECGGSKFIVCAHCGVLCQFCADVDCLDGADGKHEVIWRR
jgi:hypothetical protein